MKLISIEKLNQPSNSVKVKYCGTFFAKFLGLMFKKNLPKDSGALLVENRESKIDTSIHMLFMRFDLAVLWLDKDKVVVDKVLAKKWFPFYFPKKPSQYVLELHSSKFSEFEIGDKLNFNEIPE
jgi:uncharacterized membrane protein (UPF0127 family)